MNVRREGGQGLQGSPTGSMDTTPPQEEKRKNRAPAASGSLKVEDGTPAAVHVPLMPRTFEVSSTPRSLKMPAGGAPVYAYRPPLPEGGGKTVIMTCLPPPQTE